MSDDAQAIRIDPNLVWAYIDRGACYLSQARDGAVTEAMAGLNVHGWKDEPSLYLALIGYFGHRQMHREPEARVILDEASLKSQTMAWPFSVVRYLRHEIDEKSLLAAADNQNKETEARTYLALELALSGKTSEAVPHLRWVKEHGNSTYFEHTLADSVLTRIENKTLASRTRSGESADPGR